VSSNPGLYDCPRCHALLDANVGDWDGWLHCPVCARPALSPESAMHINDKGDAGAGESATSDSAAVAPGTGLPADAARPSFLERFAHTSPARLVFVTGLLFCLFLALIAFLDQKPARLSIFGFLAIVFFFLLLRAPKRRIAPWSAQPSRDKRATAQDEAPNDRAGP
jgi:hypothetical protein